MTFRRTSPMPSPSSTRRRWITSFKQSTNTRLCSLESGQLVGRADVDGDGVGDAGDTNIFVVISITGVTPGSDGGPPTPTRSNSKVRSSTRTPTAKTPSPFRA